MRTSDEIIQDLKDNSDYCMRIVIDTSDQNVYLEGWYSKEELIAIVYAMGLKEREGGSGDNI